MSSTSRDRRRALAFVMGGVLLLTLVLALVRGVRFARSDRTFYVAVRDSVSGLRAASPIEYKGVPVGFVRGIHFRRGSVETVEVEIAIQRGVPIKVDTRARLRPQGITGMMGLELVGGTESAASLPETGDIAIEPSLFAEVETTVRDVAALTRRLNDATATIGSDATAAVRELRAMLLACRDAALTIDATTATIGSETVLCAASLRATAEEVRRVIEDPAWAKLGGEVLAAVEDTRRAIGKLDRAAGEAERLAGENRGDLRVVIENLRRASGDARLTARRVREQPSSLVLEHPTVEKPIPDPVPAREPTR